MEVVMPMQNMEFDFDSARSTPLYLSAPSTPRRFGDFYFSAPSSPTQISAFYSDFEEFLIINDDIKKGEEKPGTPKSSKNEDDFAFDVSEEMERTSLSADELFDGGIIKLLKPPVNDQFTTHKSSLVSLVPNPKKIIRGAFSPKKKQDFDDEVKNTRKTTTESKRGREKISTSSSSSSSHRGTRSLSPLRVSQYPWEEEHQLQQNTKQSSKNSKPSIPTTTTTTTTTFLSSSSSKGCRKWRLKDFFLFRSASEGRATDKDPLKKYTAFFRKHEDLKNCSVRTIESPGSGSSTRRKGPAISAHELHYTMNRAVSKDLKKKTFLPYKQGILGRLAFNPAVHAIANGFGFSRQ